MHVIRDSLDEHELVMGTPIFLVLLEIGLPGLLKHPCIILVNF